MLKKLKNRNEGFTIVETLIVLAIAGLIILIVLLAVPALQRTSRNTNIKSDGSALSAGINEFESNNNGVTPNFFNNTNGSVAITKTGLTGALVANAKIQGSDVINTVTTAPTTVPSGDLDVRLAYTCSGQASTRAVAIYYPIEISSGAPGAGCIDS